MSWSQPKTTHRNAKGETVRFDCGVGTHTFYKLFLVKAALKVLGDNDKKNNDLLRGWGYLGKQKQQSASS